MAGTIERVLALKLIGDVGGIRKDLGKVDRQLGKTARAAASWGKAFAGAAVLGAIQGIADASIEGVKAFREEQDAVRNFNKTVKNMSAPTAKATKALDRMADRAVNLGFDDGDTIRGMDAFLQQTGNIGRATQTMGLAFDIARSRQIPLTDAIKVAQNVYKGSSRELDKYGISGVKGMAAVEAARKKERGKAAAWARNHPAEVLLGKISDGWADVVGNLSQGNFGEAVKAGQKLANNIIRGIFGYTTKEGKKVKGLWDRLFDATPGKDGKAKGILTRLGNDIGNAIRDTDWNQVFTDVLTGIKGFIDSGAGGTIATIAGALALGLFAVDAAVTALTALFSVPKLLVKGVVAAIANVGVSIAGTMFGAQKVTEAVGSTMASTVTKANNSKGLKSAAIGLGSSIGRWIGPIAAGLVIAEIGNALLDQFGYPKQGMGFDGKPIPDRAAIIKSRARRNSPEARENARRNQSEQTRRRLGSPATKGRGMVGFASGTPNAPRGWAWVGERGPELMRFRGGEQVMPHRPSMAMAGGTTVNITVNAGVGTNGRQVGEQIIDVLVPALRRGGAVRLKAALGN